MAEVKPDIETFAKIKVIGAGGGGGAAINRMVDAGIRDVEFIAVNTDMQALQHNKAQTKIHIGRTITKGLGAGMDPELGKLAAEESHNDLRDALKGADMVFITCGLGGGTGSGSSPVIAELARDSGALTIAIVTKPFSFEGAQRRTIAERALAELTDKVDAVITIPNDKLLQVIDKKTSLLDSFKIADEVLRQGVQGIAEVITVPGLINVDFADVKSIMSNAGSALMGIGQASGENKAIEAAKMAINSPLLEMSIEGARGVLFTIVGGKDLAMHEVNEAAKVITSSTDDDARIIFGAVIDERMKDEIKITVIATGFDSANKKSLDMSSHKGSPSYSPSEFLKTKTADDMPEEKRKNKISSLKAAQAEPAKSTKEADDETDDELGIPAFIRKKMM
ncbi:cell division protein FtsZ [Candidatus Falkowbacteria bacterium RIFOXYC2_FULL_47_12]|uniref:Cell division protein FtsZ n=2 Tax=Candidatus Falkowiibacteriota TaxID=1752728 RepID=A0A1F5TM98_9BACT|nr:MAG: cell division protein FtsZ [Candidatus Falkowbacteria bacterium RIFOXYA2_FULL_47_9]OGF40053.1 MAG: cell division protein FtsZ [Candidatus Falkowbacteria bacterium RIFOXYC2_FULL_47_12]